MVLVLERTSLDALAGHCFKDSLAMVVQNYTAASIYEL
jgi:hypothetical protein